MGGYREILEFRVSLEILARPVFKVYRVILDSRDQLVTQEIWDLGVYRVI